MMYCRKCGSEVNDTDIFCHVCGQQIIKTTELTDVSSNISDKKPIEEKPIEEKPIEENTESTIWGVIIIISLIGIALVTGLGLMDNIMNAVDDAYTKPATFQSDDDALVTSSSYAGDDRIMSQQEKNVLICEQVARDYYETHTYIHRK